MKITIDLLPDEANALQERTDRAIRDMEADGFNFSDWTPELEAKTILRMSLGGKLHI